MVQLTCLVLVPSVGAGASASAVAVVVSAVACLVASVALEASSEGAGASGGAGLVTSTGSAIAGLLFLRRRRCSPSGLASPGSPSERRRRRLFRDFSWQRCRFCCLSLCRWRRSGLFLCRWLRFGLSWLGPDLLSRTGLHQRRWRR